MKLVEMKVYGFVDVLASDEPAPGGGAPPPAVGARGGPPTPNGCAHPRGKKD